jgi:Rps23 Pro-64 3,4-dihydroxylase Tpa1-like proline 4-hydroxylase
MEATCYLSCCFLGGHRDDHHAANRVAFVYNLTPHWQMDWGGLLMLTNQNAQPSIVPPLWNSLAMFTVPRDHFVTAVSPAAREGRYSITGWLRDGPVVDYTNKE